MSIVTNFKDIALRLNRMDRKPEVKEEPTAPVGFWAMYGGAANGAVPVVTIEQVNTLADWLKANKI